MRFCDLFVEYKIRLDELSRNINVTRLTPGWINVLYILDIVLLADATIFGLNKWWGICGIYLILMLLLSLVIPAIDYRICIKKRLEMRYKPYSEKRMRMVIELLMQYRVDITDEKAVNLLIQQAQQAQMERDVITAYNKRLKVLFGTIITAIACIAKQIIDDLQYEVLIKIAILILVVAIYAFALILVSDSLIDLVRRISYSDYDIYSDLIDDLRQIQIFYKHNDDPTIKAVELCKEVSRTPS